LTNQRQPLPLCQFPLERKLLLNQAAQIEHGRQLFGEKFERAARFPGERRAMRGCFECSDFALPIPQSKYPRRVGPHGLWGCLQRLICTPVGERIAQSQPHSRQSERIANPLLGKFHQAGQVAVPRLLLDFGHQLLQLVHLPLKPFVKQPGNAPLQRLKEYYQREEQNCGRGLRRDQVLEPRADSPHGPQIQQRQKRR